MRAFQRTSGWILLALSLLGFLSRDWFGGMVQIESESLWIMTVFGLVSLASASKAWIKKWTYLSCMMYLLAGIIGFAAPEWVSHRIQPLEALTGLILCTWGIYQAIKAAPLVPTPPSE